ncbi:hypothetical protein [Microvirga sp. TS319]|uniref:hypothetical protein n=1 Tax=Microvirga sp. TS319 TaxID=3241165 RepID=UPI00351AAB15
MDLKRNQEQFLALVASHDAEQLRHRPCRSANTSHALTAACEEIARVPWADILGADEQRMALWSREARDYAMVLSAVADAMDEPIAQVVHLHPALQADTCSRA